MHRVSITGISRGDDPAGVGAAPSEAILRNALIAQEG